MGQVVRKFLSKLGFSAVFIRKFVLIAIAVGGVSAYKTLNNVLNSNVVGEFVAEEELPDGRKRRGVITFEKLAPPVRNKNLLVLSTNSENKSYLGYYRYYGNALTYDLYIGGGIGKSLESGDTMAQIGIVIGF